MHETSTRNVQVHRHPLHNMTQVLHRARLFIWGEIPSSQQERRLLLKIDWFILSYCCLMVCFGRLIWITYWVYWTSTRLLLSGLDSTSRIVSSVFNYFLFPNRWTRFRSSLVWVWVSDHWPILLLADLDRSNVANAYVSGMKEELNMQGNEYNVCFVPFFLHDTDILIEYWIFYVENHYGIHLWVYCWHDPK